MVAAPTLEELHPLLHRIAVAIVKCEEDAEDIVQETLLSWLTFQQERIRDVKSYLARSVRNACFDHLKDRQPDRMDVEKVDAQQSRSFFTVPELDLEARLEQALHHIHHRLEPLERAVFVLREGFGLDYEALSVAVQKKKEHCRQLLCRARQKMTSGSMFSGQSASAQWFEPFHAACASGDPAPLIGQLRSDIDTDKK